MEKIYDLIIICFTDPKLDARTINLTKTLVKYCRKVGLITPDYGHNVDYLDDSDYYRCQVDLNQRVRHSHKEFTKQVKKLRFKTRYVHSGDFYSLSAAKAIKTKSGAKLIYDSREIYSQLNSLLDRPLAKKIIEFKEKFLITYVDRMFVTAEEDERYLKKHFMHNIPYSIIKNLPPKIEIHESNKLREHFNISESKLVLLYQGWVLKGRGLDKLVISMKEIDTAELVIIGGGNYLQNLKSLVEELRLSEKVHFTGFIDYSELTDYTMSADIGFVLFEDTSISYQNALPNKLFEYIQCGIPVITTSQKAISDIVNKDSIGKVIEKVEKDLIVNAVQEMSALENRMKYSNNIMQIREQYSYESQEIELLKVFS